MMRKRVMPFGLWVVVGLAALAALVAESRLTGATGGSPPDGDLLFLAELEQDGAPALVLRDGASGVTEDELSYGALSPDGATLFTVRLEAGATILRAIELATGAERGKAIVQGHYELPATRLGTQHGGLSPNGQWLALQKVVGSQSRFAVFETSLDGPPRVATLPGRFHFDALSNDGRSLYLTEHLAEEEPLRYQVRRYDLFLDALDPRVIADKSGSGPMLGRYLSSLPSRTGEWLYSLYLNETKGPFIHALNLNNRWAICIFLPDQGKEQLELQLRWTMTLSEDGKSLYAANGALGRVVEVDTTDHRVRRMAAFDLAQPETAGDLRERLLPWFASAASAKRAMLGSATLANAGDTLFVSGERGLLVIDTEELELREHLLLDWTFDSGVLSPDGTRLYLSSGERRSILALDARSYALLDEIEVGGNLVGILYVADR